MIVHRPELQAYECDGCGKVYEIQRNRGTEDDLNKAIDFKRRISAQHAGCVLADDVEPAMTVLQRGVQSVIA